MPPREPDDASATLVVDTTFRCNARCTYCRWGDGRTAERADQPADTLCLDHTVLQAADVGRVVFSGGEPLLHPQLGQILTHYRRVEIPARVIITNGLLATRGRIAECVFAGATGFAFSIDAVDERTARTVRGMNAPQLTSVLAHLAEAGEAARRREFELTVNCVLSASNCRLDKVRDLVWAVHERGVTFVKFQPVFDDGYLGYHAPELRLDTHHAEVIRAIAEDASTWPVSTNRPAFFADLANFCEGRPLDGLACGLGDRTFLLQGGGLVVCPWIGMTPATLARDIRSLVHAFHEAKKTCTTGSHCFCLQPKEHAWRWTHEVS